MADLAGREAAAQGRLGGRPRPRLEGPQPDVVQPDLGLGGRSSKASADTLTRQRPPPAAQSTARSRRPSGVAGVVEVSS